MRLIVATVECEPHAAVNAADLVRTCWSGAVGGDLLEHVLAVSTARTWRICVYTRLLDPSEARAAVEELVRRTLASATGVDRWRIVSVTINL